MRLGQEDEPFKQLEMCYNNGYRDAETVNSLRLLDSYKNFVTYKENDHPAAAARVKRSCCTRTLKRSCNASSPPTTRNTR